MLPTVYYFTDTDYEDRLQPGDWKNVNLFINSDIGKEPKLDSDIITVSYIGDGWSDLVPEVNWEEWSYKLPNGFWRRVIKAIFGKKM